jgi:hypothetical protein
LPEAGWVACLKASHPSEQLAHPERLGDVVVGAAVERVDLLALLDAGREHDDRHRRPLAEVLDDFQSVQVGQPEVDDREVGLVHAGVDLAAPAVGRLHHAVALRVQ